jgi:EmrB/QacA subfamily drug resistance transporter
VITFLIVSVGLFMVTLDNLVVSTALPVIRVDLNAPLESLEWMVNAYTLSYAVFLLTGAALAPSADFLVTARAIQGLGAALVTPLSLTLLSAAVPDEKRGLAIGAWSGVSGLGVAMGPVIGGAITEGIAWQWIFWVNVPIGLVVAPLAAWKLIESYGPDRGLDPRGLILAVVGLFPLTFGIVRSSALGWGNATVVVSIIFGLVMMGFFLLHEGRTKEPMLPLRFFRSRAFSATNAVSFVMFFGIFGSIFFLSQYFITVQGMTPLQAGIRILPWTAMPIFIAPIAGLFSDRFGARPFMVAGLALQAFAIAWIAKVSQVDTAYSEFVPAFIAGGAGMALVFAPSANAVLSSVRPVEAGKASGATNAIRELGGVAGVAVLASVFAAAGGYASPQDFVDGVRAALPVGAAVLLAGAFIALLIPRQGAPGTTGARRTDAPATDPSVPSMS